MNNLKQIRKNRGLSQKQLSELTGIKVRTIGSWEDGSVSLAKAAFINVMRIAGVLEVDPMYLIGGDLDES